jgi:hypothetical protein
MPAIIQFIAEWLLVGCITPWNHVFAWSALSLSLMQIGTVQSK